MNDEIKMPNWVFIPLTLSASAGIVTIVFLILGLMSFSTVQKPPVATSTASTVCYDEEPGYQLTSWNVTLYDCGTHMPLFPVEPNQ
jgi:hypothetical protein